MTRAEPKAKICRSLPTYPWGWFRRRRVGNSWRL